MCIAIDGSWISERQSDQLLDRRKTHTTSKALKAISVVVLSLSLFQWVSSIHWRTMVRFGEKSSCLSDPTLLSMSSCYGHSGTMTQPRCKTPVESAWHPESLVSRGHDWRTLKGGVGYDARFRIQWLGTTVAPCAFCLIEFEFYSNISQEALQLNWQKEFSTEVNLIGRLTWPAIPV